MISLPIVARELRVRSRLRSTHHLRWLVAGGALALSLSLVGGSAARPGGGTGQSAFYSLTVLAMLFCLFEGPRSTADCLSQEKRDGTLGLLFLTDLRGFDVVLGKLAATSLNSVYGLLALVPVMALPILVGGVTFGEFSRVVLVLLNTLFLSLCVGLWVSARRREHFRSVAETIFILGLLLGGGPMVDLLVAGRNLGLSAAGFSVLSPAIGCVAAFDGTWVPARSLYWWSLVVVHLIAWGFLIGASVTLIHHWREVGHPPAKARLVLGKRPRDLGDTHPIGWLVWRQVPRLWWVWVLVVVSLATTGWQASFLMGAGATTPRPVANMAPSVVLMLIQFSIHLGLAVAACCCLAEARATGAIESLLTTPLPVREIVHMHARTLRSVVAPVILGQIVLLVGSHLVWRLSRVFISMLEFYWLSVSVITQVVVLLTNAWAIIWVGMWLGLSSKRLGEAVTKTLLYVIVLPWILFRILPWSYLMIWGSGYGFFILYPLVMTIKNIVLVRWAKKHLLQDFRQTAAGPAGPRTNSRLQMWWSKRGIEVPKPSEA